MSDTHRIDSGDVHVFTFKDGLLSRFGHDLRLSVGSFSVELAGADVTASFEVASLQVDGAVSGGRLVESELKASDRADIKKNLDKKVLHTAKHPRISFSGKVSGAGAGATVKVAGQLELHGSRRPLEVTVERQDGRLRGRIELTPSQWGVAPFKAMMGALRVKDRVDVAFDLPDPTA